MSTSFQKIFRELEKFGKKYLRKLCVSCKRVILSLKHYPRRETTEDGKQMFLCQGKEQEWNFVPIPAVCEPKTYCNILFEEEFFYHLAFSRTLLSFRACGPESLDTSTVLYINKNRLCSNTCGTDKILGFDGKRISDLCY